MANGSIRKVPTEGGGKEVGLPQLRCGIQPGRGERGEGMGREEGVKRHCSSGFPDGYLKVPSPCLRGDAAAGCKCALAGFDNSAHWHRAPAKCQSLGKCYKPSYNREKRT